MTAEARSARKAATDRVLEACYQTIDPASTRLDTELSGIVADMALLARAICAMAESPVCIGARGDTLFTGFEQVQVDDVRRLAMWIDDIAQRALADLEGAEGEGEETKTDFENA